MPWIVELEYGCASEGKTDFMHFGPFDEQEEAVTWMDEYPEDSDTVDMRVFELQAPPNYNFDRKE